MKKNNRRTAKVIFMAFVLGLLLSIAGTAFASSFAGTSSDPLVSQSWVEEYLNSHFSALEKEVDAIGVAVQEALGLSQVDIVLTIGSANATVNGAAKTIDADNSRVVPYINSDSRTMVPVRFVAEQLGAQVFWDNSTRTVSIIKTGKTIHMTIDQKTYYVNGQTKTMDTAPVIHQGWNRTMVPVRFVAEALGCNVDWAPKNNTTTTVYISN